MTPNGSSGDPDFVRPSSATLWKDDWGTAKRHFAGWWQKKDLVLWVTSPKDKPWDDVPPPPAVPATLQGRWYDPAWKVGKATYQMSRTYYGGDSFPMFGTWTGAGDLAAYLGCRTELSESTVWFHPAIEDPEGHPPLRFDAASEVAKHHLALARDGLRVSRGRFFVSVPDIVENVDILAALRGTEALMMDMVERPEWVEKRVWEINAAYFDAFELFYRTVRDVDGGNTGVFGMWGPGKTCKVQCDACSMFGPEMFRRFVVPAMTEQCRRLDYAMFHLDGEDCLPNLEPLLEIEPLRAIEWTPRRLAVGDSGGHPRHHDLYRRILRAGKAVQAIGVKYEEVIPLLDAVGPRGVYIMTSAPSENAARELEERVARYRGT